MSIAIRDFHTEDYDALVALWEEAGLPYKPQGRDSQEEIARQIRHSTAIYLIAEHNGVLVGSVLCTNDGRKGWINRLAVSPVHRRRGIARKLVEEAEKRFLALGIEIYACLIEDWNSISMKVFECLGYHRHSDILYFSKRKHPDI
ncbi:MAG: hypothetical protein A2Z21_03935 [Candidatus Fraserbacteria bacterium RBG_16_55_9]|uniref:N-acetyltransferase domain-containing protein n=1 Tax=Fraserbacteria sp. (strain RBG_16_55_9) TaxID=1817864 RepID=A0A1F5UYZ7_FRAXR|nr:MAG: hypothetical protein A2Z21_03935 [Candidatus Fraserbacteria bacterium RBG_16_55_9]